VTTSYGPATEAASTYYSSGNGSSWPRVGSATIALGTAVYGGLAVTSHDNARVTTASIDSISR
jgi:hypothetical protein